MEAEMPDNERERECTMPGCDQTLFHKGPCTSEVLTATNMGASTEHPAEERRNITAGEIIAGAKARDSHTAIHYDGKDGLGRSCRCESCAATEAGGEGVREACMFWFPESDIALIRGVADSDDYDGDHRFCRIADHMARHNAIPNKASTLPPGASEAEPVEWQLRVPGYAWIPATEEQAQKYGKLSGYETRALYTHPPGVAEASE